MGEVGTEQQAEATPVHEIPTSVYDQLDSQFGVIDKDIASGLKVRENVEGVYVFTRHENTFYLQGPVNVMGYSRLSCYNYTPHIKVTDISIPPGDRVFQVEQDSIRLLDKDYERAKDYIRGDRVFITTQDVLDLMEQYVAAGNSVQSNLVDEFNRWVTSPEQVYALDKACEEGRAPHDINLSPDERYTFDLFVNFTKPVLKITDSKGEESEVEYFWRVMPEGQQLEEGLENMVHHLEQVGVTPTQVSDTFMRPLEA